MKVTATDGLKLKKSIVHSLWLPLVILVVGVFFAIDVNQQETKNTDAQIKNALDERLSQITENVKDRVTLYGYGLQSLRSAIATIGLDHFNYQRMQRYIQSHHYNDDYPQPRGLGLIRVVEQQNKAAFLEFAKNERPDKEFNLKQLSAHEDSLFVIQYIEPELKNKQALGLDIGSEKMRRHAAIRAAEHNSPWLTAPITLVQANKQTMQGFLILSPIFSTATPPKSTEQRLASIRAWSYSPILIDEVLHGISSLKQDILLSITDITSAPSLSFFNFGDSHSRLNQYHSEQTIELLGRTWQLALTATPEFLNELNLVPPYQRFTHVMIITFVIMLVFFSAQLIFMRNTQLKAHRLALAQTREKALTESNLRLEGLVAQRTAEMATNNALQKSILVASSYTIIATDIEGTITLINPAGEQMLGYSADELIGKQNPGIFHLIDEVIERAAILSDELGYPITPGFETFVAKARLGEPDINRWTYINKNGHHIQVKLSVNCLHNDQNQLLGFLGIAADLTTQLKHEQALAQAKERAEKAAKSKSEFLANMSHEIRTPMNGLFGVLQLLKEDTLSEQGQYLLDKALYSAKSLTVIINDILDFSKIEAGKLTLEPHDFKLSELIEHLNSDLSVNAFTKQIYLKFERNVSHDMWHGDQLRIHQILLNIISNAIKFTKTGGVTVIINTLNPQEGLAISVVDTGIGISNEALTRLFHRFEQADKSTTRHYGGTGLGLSISHSLVELMNGTISVKSKENHGSTFSISLPLAQSTAPEHQQSQAVTQLNLTNKTIVIAEDNAINIIVVTAMLKSTHATLVIAHNGIEAIEMTEQHQPDLILMDIQMPRMDGITACQKIKAVHPSLPIVALTANAFAEDKALYDKVGFDGYLAKPLTNHDLLFEISKALHLQE